MIWFGSMLFTATLNNISVISWWSVLLMGETGVPEIGNERIKRYFVVFPNERLQS